MPRRILVLSASVGAGHLRAAEAMTLALRQLAPGDEVRSVDVLDLTNAAFRRVYGRLYLDLVNKAPHALGYFYDRLDRPSRSGKNRGDALRRVVQRANLPRLTKLLTAEPWDLAVSTHFLPAEVIAGLKKRNGLPLPHATVTTDFETHRLWVNAPCERYFTATEEGARYLAHWGAPADGTFATGIPVHPVFAAPKDPAACRQKHALSADRPVVLQLAGGFGVGPVEKLFDALCEVDRPIHLVAVSGRNAKLKAGLAARPVPARHRVTVLGFTTEIDELMAAADLVVSKPGGLTTSEALARGAAMVVVNPIPGQESRNSDFLLENGAAIKANNAATLGYKVGALLADPARLAVMRAAVTRIARPRAAFDVAAKALELIR